MDAQEQFNSTKVFPFPAWEKYLLKTSINFLIALFKKSFGCDYALPGQILNRYDNKMESTKKFVRKLLGVGAERSDYIESDIIHGTIIYTRIHTHTLNVHIRRELCAL